eukprot:7222963-Prymnesium_polylepis.1
MSSRIQGSTKSVGSATAVGNSLASSERASACWLLIVKRKATTASTWAGTSMRLNGSKFCAWRAHRHQRRTTAADVQPALAGFEASGAAQSTDAAVR